MKTVVLASGGLDSTTLLYVLRETGHDVVPLGFDYGQPHRRELESARAICAGLQLPFHVVTLPPLQRGRPPIPSGHYADESMKATVVPNRNMIMLAVAVGLAVDQHCDAVAYAAHGGDHPIYPDCRPAFVDAMRLAITAGNWHPVDLVAPFLTLTKSQIVTLGDKLDVPFAQTWSCYRGQASHCGTCGTCTERREAFALAHVPDPTAYH